MDQKHIDGMADHLSVLLNPDPATAMMERTRIALYLATYWKDKVAIVRTIEDVREKCDKVIQDVEAKAILNEVMISIEEEDLVDELIELQLRQSGRGSPSTRPLGPPVERVPSVIHSRTSDLDEDEDEDK